MRKIVFCSYTVTDYKMFYSNTLGDS